MKKQREKYIGTWRHVVGRFKAQKRPKFDDTYFEVKSLYRAADGGNTLMARGDMTEGKMITQDRALPCAWLDMKYWRRIN